MGKEIKVNMDQLAAVAREVGQLKTPASASHGQLMDLVNTNPRISGQGEMLDAVRQAAEAFDRLDQNWKDLIAASEAYLKKAGEGFIRQQQEIIKGIGKSAAGTDPKSK